MPQASCLRVQAGAILRASGYVDLDSRGSSRFKEDQFTACPVRGRYAPLPLTCTCIRKQLGSHRSRKNEGASEGRWRMLRCITRFTMSGKTLPGTPAWIVLLFARCTTFRQGSKQILDHRLPNPRCVASLHVPLQRGVCAWDHPRYRSTEMARTGPTVHQCSGRSYRWRPLRRARSPFLVAGWRRFLRCA
jgi:hypothetical protein